MFEATRTRILIGIATCALAQAGCAKTLSDFQGDWAYKQTCGTHHSAELKLVQAGHDVIGQWADGDRSSGSDGLLKGRVREGKLFMRYCGNDEQAGYTICPDYEADEADYLVRQGDNLVWYRMAGSKGAGAFEKYVVLHRVTSRPIATDDGCEGH